MLARLPFSPSAKSPVTPILFECSSFSVTSLPRRYSSAVFSSLLNADRSWYIHSIWESELCGIMPSLTCRRFKSSIYFSSLRIFSRSVLCFFLSSSRCSASQTARTLFMFEGFQFFFVRYDRPILLIYCSFLNSQIFF